MELISSVKRKRLESFIIMDSGHHHYQISDFKTDNSDWG